MIVDIGIATSKSQAPKWWSNLIREVMRAQESGIRIGRVLAVGSAQNDFSRNKIGDWFLKPANTAENRNVVVSASDADAIWWIDDDTVPPEGTLAKLVEVKADIVAGTYYRRSAPYDPVAYGRLETGLYVPIFDFQVGEVIDVDSVGMGCTLVHRRVYERIKEQYVLFRRALTNTLIPVHRDDVVNLERAGRAIRENAGKVLVTNDGLFRIEPLVPLEKPPERWPFYAMEYERTEDHALCELAKRLGFRIVVDTSIECTHLGEREVTGNEFRAIRRAYLAEKERQHARS